ncbi:MAG: nuclear transport factor 2 family protein [Mycolicibacterium sp.]|nr:nuclear transport factor 2 family protein [Mycolicibacterium sp.]
MTDMAERFVSALGELHSSNDVDPLVELFGDDATLSKAGLPHQESGKGGARAFWQQYRDVFGDIESDFKHQVVDGDLVVLEWTSNGTLRDGSDFSYDGVSIFEADGETITAFRTYYDTAAFLNAEAKR